MSLLVLALNGSFKKKKRLLLHKQTTQDKKKIAYKPITYWKYSLPSPDLYLQTFLSQAQPCVDPKAHRKCTI